MLSVKFAYLTANILFLLVWLIIFLFRKDLRNQMLVVGASLIIPGVLLEYFIWTEDWWRPLTITNTRIGIEDLMLALTNGGIAAVLYEVVAYKKIKFTKSRLSVNKLAFLLIFPLAYFSLYFIMNFSSFFISVIVFILTLSIIYFLRKDLIKPSLLSGVLLTLVVLPIYYLTLLVFPNIVEEIWLTEDLSGLYFIGYPIEDFVFYFFSGAYLGVIYEFVYNANYTRYSNTDI